MSDVRNVDDGPLREAKRIGGHRSNRETVEAVLREHAPRRRRLSILELLGTIDFDPDWDPKAGRRKRTTPRE